MKTKTAFIILSISALGLYACTNHEKTADAYGNFEAIETLISAQTAGQILEFEIHEGDLLQAGQAIGLIDTVDLWLKKAQLNQQKNVIRSRKIVLQAQLKVQEQQLANNSRDQKRIHQLFDAGAATQKQKEDIDGAIALISNQIAATRAQYTGIEAEIQVIDSQIAQINETLQKSILRNPIEGTVLNKYAEPGEIATPGKPLYKIANLSFLDLKAYITGIQLTDFILNQEVKVLIDGSNEAIELPGTISWIASSAEFTPKTIQTKEERTDLVYAIKVRVGNDGRLKIGMPGEVHLINH
ncbi:MAG: efflux RND transporter periplasmic adaptor subunit [Bacteroidetes bacterium]|nr:efflux RND transporter periplasmic adaptor subunit [Bacteroidota bacterium]MBU1579496.1 efflux RND transporter periplasmic adaptor subunit [Bacteroidota bacterium]MBU2466597.1 efflux RND transporter periplasmic adaptor subunit [Bacteroidota bacterium]MBU2557067.1 efflux RND transporter periplasmic adaptor subunit [Bacteroidota bacterium]